MTMIDSSSTTFGVDGSVKLSVRRRLNLQGMGGSLPLKKRRLILPMALPDDGFGDESSRTNTANTTTSDASIKCPPESERIEPTRSSELPPPRHPLPFLPSANTADENATDDERLAVLALMAARTHQPTTPSVSSTTTTTTTTARCASPTDNSSVSSSSQEDASNDNMDTASVMSLQQHSSHHDPTNVSASPKRSHHPRLDAPLPGGCHGRTSRNNSYCRRQPYKGGIYCKLHYQQYMLRGSGGGPNEPQQDAQQQQQHETVRASVVASPPTLPDIQQLQQQQQQQAQEQQQQQQPSLQQQQQQNQQSPAQQHQDKRYVGTDDNEMRCQATTTRGRECAYVAVNGTKYCYLHADYDTNPPPRRGGAALRKTDGSSSTESVNGATGAVAEGENSPSPFGDENESQPGGPSTGNDVRKNLTPSSKGKGNRSGTESSKRSKRPNNANNVNPNSPFPLLSTIPTENWAGKRVIVSSGPFMNRCGSVEKWGNGWVSVQISGGGVHNRRAFELYIHPDQSGGSNDGEQTVQANYFFPSSENEKSPSAAAAAAALWNDSTSLRPISSASSEADDQEATERLAVTPPAASATSAPSHFYLGARNVHQPEWPVSRRLISNGSVDHHHHNSNHHHHHHHNHHQHHHNHHHHHPSNEERYHNFRSFPSYSEAPPHTRRIGSPIETSAVTALYGSKNGTSLPPIVTPRAETATFQTMLSRR